MPDKRNNYHNLLKHGVTQVRGPVSSKKLSNRKTSLNWSSSLIGLECSVPCMIQLTGTVRTIISALQFGRVLKPTDKRTLKCKDKVNGKNDGEPISRRAHAFEIYDRLDTSYILRFSGRQRNRINLTRLDIK